jgi:hypothetical protein
LSDFDESWTELGQNFSQSDGATLLVGGGTTCFAVEPHTEGKAKKCPNNA